MRSSSEKAFLGYKDKGRRKKGKKERQNLDCGSTNHWLGAGVAQSVQCLTADWTTGVRFPAQDEDFTLDYVQTGSEAHPASCPMGTGSPVPGGKTRKGA
jgi:hypothetical protein